MLVDSKMRGRLLFVVGSLLLAGCSLGLLAHRRYIQTGGVITALSFEHPGFDIYRKELDSGKRIQIGVGERDKSERAIADVQVSILKVEEAIPADGAFTIEVRSSTCHLVTAIHQLAELVPEMTAAPGSMPYRLAALPSAQQRTTMLDARYVDPAEVVSAILPSSFVAAEQVVAAIVKRVAVHAPSASVPANRTGPNAFSLNATAAVLDTKKQNASAINATRAVVPPSSASSSAVSPPSNATNATTAPTHAASSSSSSSASATSIANATASSSPAASAKPTAAPIMTMTDNLKSEIEQLMALTNIVRSLIHHSVGVPTSTLQKVTQYRKTLGAFCESASIVATPARANNTAVPVPNANSIYEPPY